MLVVDLRLDPEVPRDSFKRAQVRDQPEPREPLDDADTHRFRFGLPGRAKSRVIEKNECLLDAGKNTLPFQGRVHPPAMSGEDRQTRPFFDDAHAPAYGAVWDTEHFGRGRERTCRSGRQGGLQGVKRWQTAIQAHI
jgi:hypothetical protein